MNLNYLIMYLTIIIKICLSEERVMNLNYLIMYLTIIIKICLSEERVTNLNELTFCKYMKQTVKTNKVSKEPIHLKMRHLFYLKFLSCF
jgi:hypothetical protein